MAFPQTRLRRLRRTGALRDLVRETDLRASDLILPIFVVAGLDGRESIGSMPGIDRLSISAAVEEAGEAAALGISGVLLFGVPSAKDEEGSQAWDDEGVVQLATRAIKDAHPDLLVVSDLCLCEYTSHGHCGVLRDDGQVDNDATLELLARAAISQARAGADAIAPSDMMDGRVGAIRAALDEEDFGAGNVLLNRRHLPYAIPNPMLHSNFNDGNRNPPEQVPIPEVDGALPRARREVAEVSRPCE